MSEEAQVANETVVDSATPKADGDDLNQKFVAEIANSKKLRSRAQEAESMLEKANDKLKNFKDDQLKKNEEYQTLYEQEKTEHEKAKVLADMWVKHEATTRKELLEMLPDEEKPKWGEAPLDYLKDYVAKVANVATPNPDHVSNQTRNTKVIPGDWTKMDDRERRNNWANIVNQYKK